MARIPEVDRPCVYRVYDPSTYELLYIGQTCKRNKRMREHGRKSHWFPYEYRVREAVQAGLIQYEEHTSQLAAMVAEAWAIRAERPRHNKDRPNPAAVAALAEEWAAKWFRSWSELGVPQYVKPYTAVAVAQLLLRGAEA